MNLSGSFVGLTLLALFAPGCLNFSGPQFQGTAHGTQAALVAAPSGPGIWGPPVAPRRAYVELAISHDPGTEGAVPRASGGLAHVTAGTRAAVQAVFRPVPRLELGPSLEWGFGDRTAASPDTPTSFLGAEWFRVGLHLRGHVASGHNWAFGVNLDVLASIIAYQIAGSISVTQLVSDSCLGRGLCMDWSSSGQDTGRGRVVEVGPSRNLPSPGRAGGSAALSPHPRHPVSATPSFENRLIPRVFHTARAVPSLVGWDRTIVESRA